MKSSLFLAGVLLATSAYAGVTGNGLITYTIQNNTGATASSLTVNVNDLSNTTVENTSPFTNATMNPVSIDFSGGSVDNGSAETFTLQSNNVDDLSVPFVNSYQWSSEPNVENLLELFFGIDSPNPFGPNALFLDSSDPSNSHSFDNLYAMQGGSSILTVGTSGSLGPAGSEQVTGDIDFGAGPITFGVTDLAQGVTISGEFTATPEPATTGLCALMFLGLVVVVRRRQLRQQ